MVNFQSLHNSIIRKFEQGHDTTDHSEHVCLYQHGISRSFVRQNAISMADFIDNTMLSSQNEKRLDTTENSEHVCVK